MEYVEKLNLESNRRRRSTKFYKLVPTSVVVIVFNRNSFISVMCLVIIVVLSVSKLRTVSCRREHV